MEVINNFLKIIAMIGVVYALIGLIFGKIYQHNYNNSLESIIDASKGYQIDFDKTFRRLWLLLVICAVLLLANYI